METRTSSSALMPDVSNERLADLLERIADLLAQQDANPFRTRAYRTAAQYVRDAPGSLADLVSQGGNAALEALPHIGKGLAATIGEFVRTGHSSLLERLQEPASSEEMLKRIPGIGVELAARVVAQLDVKTLEELEQAAHDGRLKAVEGFGTRRVEAVRAILAGRLSGVAQRRSPHGVSRDAASAARQRTRPAVALLLDVDAEYRQRAEAGDLQTIAPRRFNPEHTAWLPIMHSQRDAWTFTVLYSNTARAHELDATHDWVVIYGKRQDQSEEIQHTVVTATHGPLAGKRIVRGREKECRQYYKLEQAQQGDLVRLSYPS
jgi:hypothetical protein